VHKRSDKNIKNVVSNFACVIVLDDSFIADSNVLLQRSTKYRYPITRNQKLFILYFVKYSCLSVHVRK
jgi:hypothetical protein